MCDAQGNPISLDLFLGRPGPTPRPAVVKKPDVPPDPKETPARLARARALSFTPARPPTTPR